MGIWVQLPARTSEGTIAMKRICFWSVIVFAILVTSSGLTSDNPHVELCTRLVNANKSTTDHADTVTHCRFITTSYSAGCLEAIAAGFAKYPLTDESVYDGIDSSHIFACALFRHGSHESSIKCLREILMRRHPTVPDINACFKRNE